MLETLKKYSFSIFIALTISLGFFSKPQTISAQATCSRAGQCVNNRRCMCVADCGIGEGDPVLILGDEECGAAIIGGVTPPTAVHNININSRGEIGAIFFLSRLIRFGSIVAGIFVIWNFISAGFTYISSAGNTSAQEGVKDKLTWSIVGIILIVSAYTIAGLIGLIFFNDPTFILNPQLEGAI